MGIKPLLTAAVLLCLAGCIHKTLLAQTTALLPTGKFQGFSSNGVPLNGGCVYTYAAGTTTPQASYTDSTGGSQNNNPVILDSAGRANIWLSASLYKIKLQDGPNNGTVCSGAIEWTTDNVSVPRLLSSSITISTGNSF